MADLLKKKFTNYLVTQMAFHLAKQSYGSKLEEQDKALEKLGDDIYASHFASDLELITSLPDGWLNVKNSLSLKFVSGKDNTGLVNFPTFQAKDYSGKRIGRMKNDFRESASITMTDFMRIPHHWTTYSIPIHIESEFAKRLVKIKTDIAELEKAQYDFYDEMVSLLTNLGSFRALYDFWPEVREIVREYEPEPPPPKMLPTAPINDYNKLLEIPKEKVMTATA